MAQYDAVLNDTEKRFDRVLDSTTIPTQLITIKLLSNDKLKDPYKVQKANQITQYLNNIEVIIVINEIILEKLDDRQKDMLFDEALAQIEVNYETGAVKIVRPDFCTFSGVMAKYGNEDVVRYKESIKAAKDIKKNDDAQESKA